MEIRQDCDEAARRDGAWTTTDMPHPTPGIADHADHAGLAASAPAEIEVKLFVPASSVDRVWTERLVVDHAIGPRQVERLSNRYFDTPRRELAAQRMALRLRGNGSGWVQTVKSSGSDRGSLSRRGEWEEAVDGAALDWDKLAATPLADFVARPASRKRLRPVFTTDFERESQRLRLSDGSEVEFAFDRGTIAAAGAADADLMSTICEIEIELKQPGRDDPATVLLRFAASLARSLPVIPLGASKAARGHALADGRGSQATRATLPRAPADSTPAHHLGRVLAACNDALLVNAHALIDAATRNGDPVEPVHQARVAIRRMRSALRLFRPTVDSRRLRSLDRDLQRLARLFGTLRDEDVFMTATMPRLDEHVGRDAEGHAALATIRDELETRRSAARRALLEALDVGPFGTTTLEVERVVARLARADHDGPTLGACAGPWLARQYARVVKGVRRLATQDDEERHRLRIEVKRLRYALDLLGGLYDDDAVAAFHESLANLQDRLGALNDEAVARGMLRSLTSGAALDLVLARDDAWFAHRLHKQLPKVAAEAMKLQLAPRPWTSATVADR